MHVTLRRIVSQDTRGGNELFAFGEPALGPEPRFSLAGRGWHAEESDDADNEGEETFDEEKPSGK